MTGAPLGRHAGDAEGRLHPVRLLGLPVRLLLDSRDRHDSLLREFALLAITEDGERPRPPGLVELTQLLGVQYGAPQGRPDEAVDAALRQGLASIDVAFEVTGSVVGAAAQLEALMAEADEFCRTQQLLTLPRNPLQQRFSAWYLEEFRCQVGGAPPRPWHGPLDP